MPDLSAFAASAYLAVLVLVAVDAIVPIVPGEAAVVAGGVLAASGELQPALLLAATVAGALVGDSTAYGLGRRARRLGLGRALKAKRGRRVIVWAAGALDRQGGSIVVAARFVPGGRTSAAVAAGFLRYPLGRYLRWGALGAVLWAVYTAGLGYVGGRTFADRPWLALLLGLAAAGVVGLIALARVTIRDARDAASPAEADPPLALSGGRDRTPERYG